ncbi:hypothetical protein [Salinifilum aidingensis]
MGTDIAARTSRIRIGQAANIVTPVAPTAAEAGPATAILADLGMTVRLDGKAPDSTSPREVFT